MKVSSIMISSYTKSCELGASTGAVLGLVDDHLGQPGGAADGAQDGLQEGDAVGAHALVGVHDQDLDEEAVEHRRQLGDAAQGALVVAGGGGGFDLAAAAGQGRGRGGAARAPRR